MWDVCGTPGEELSRAGVCSRELAVEKEKVTIHSDWRGVSAACCTLQQITCSEGELGLTGNLRSAPIDVLLLSTLQTQPASVDPSAQIGQRFWPSIKAQGGQNPSGGRKGR